jgi:hypothetical protein
MDNKEGYFTSLIKMKYINEHLDIIITDNYLTVNSKKIQNTQTVKELSLYEFSEAYRLWNNLVQTLDIPKEELNQALLFNKRVRSIVQKVLKKFGLSILKLTSSQIIELLFFSKGENGKLDVALLFKFHNCYPELNINNSKEDELVLSKAPKIDNITLAKKYAIQSLGGLEALNRLTLNEVMSIYNSTSYYNFVSIEENKKKILDEYFEEQVKSKDLSEDDVLGLMKGEGGMVVGS